MKPEEIKHLQTLEGLKNEGIVDEQELQETLTWAIDKLSGIVSGMVPNQHPPRHQPFVVKRDNIYFTATPVYGMHGPWWSLTYPTGDRMLQATTPMKDGDEFWSLVDQLRRDR